MPAPSDPPAAIHQPSGSERSPLQDWPPALHGRPRQYFRARCPTHTPAPIHEKPGATDCRAPDRSSLFPSLPHAVLSRSRSPRDVELKVDPFRTSIWTRRFVDGREHPSQTRLPRAPEAETASPMKTTSNLCRGRTCCNDRVSALQRAGNDPLCRAWVPARHRRIALIHATVFGADTCMGRSRSPAGAGRLVDRDGHSITCGHADEGQ